MSQEKRAVVSVQEPKFVSFPVEELLTKAIDKGVPVETMERLLAMRRELRAEQAKVQFDQAIARFQSACPEIAKTKEVKTSNGQVAYRYAPIESIVSQVKNLLGENLLSYSFETETKENAVKVVCVVKHQDGHSEHFSVEVPLGNKTNVMSASQVVAAAITFAKRYAFCNAFGIMTGEEDTDAKQVAEKEQVMLDVSHENTGSPSEDLERASLRVGINRELKRLGKDEEWLNKKTKKMISELSVKQLEGCYEQLKALQIEATPTTTSALGKEYDGIPIINN